MEFVVTCKGTICREKFFLHNRIILEYYICGLLELKNSQILTMVYDLGALYLYEYKIDLNLV